MKTNAPKLPKIAEVFTKFVTDPRLNDFDLSKRWKESEIVLIVDGTSIPTNHASASPCEVLITQDPTSRYKTRHRLARTTIPCYVPHVFVRNDRSDIFLGYLDPQLTESEHRGRSYVAWLQRTRVVNKLA